MTKEQIEIADLLLRFLKEQGKALNTDQLTHFARQQNINEVKISQARNFLIEEGLLHSQSDNYWVELSREGYKAAGTELEKYFEQKEQDRGKININGHNVVFSQGNQNTNTITENAYLNRSRREPSEKPERKEQTTVITNHISSWVKIISAIITAIGAAIGIYFKYFN